MSRFKFSVSAAGCLAAVLAVSVAVSVPAARAQAAAVDPAAVQILKKMTDYLGSLQTFSVHTRIDMEDLLESGHMVDVDVAASVTVSRPDKLRAERRGGLLEQEFYYDGKTLTLYNPSEGLYATEPAPAAIEGMLDVAREQLGLVIPASDLLYRNAFALLMQDVTLAAVVGKAVIGGVVCDHLLFSRPGVDFQVWVAEADQPLPYKYVVTDMQSPGHLSIGTVMSEWNTAPVVAASQFSFVPPEEAKAIIFMQLEPGSAAGR